MPYCKNCGQEIEANAKFCSNCGMQFSEKPAAAEVPPYAPSPAKPATWKKTFLLVGGILAIIAVALLIVSSIISIIIGIVDLYQLIVGIIGLIAFGLGLPACIMIIKRRNVYFSIVGLSLVVAAACMTFASWLLVIGIPMMILAIISLIFVALAKSEFH